MGTDFVRHFEYSAIMDKQYLFFGIREYKFRQIGITRLRLWKVVF